MQVCSNCGQPINYSRDAISAKQKYFGGNTSILNCDITVLYPPIDITQVCIGRDHVKNVTKGRDAHFKTKIS